MPKREETAELIVNGTIYREWESVMVKRTMRDKPPYWFRFTCSEGLPIGANWTVLRIRPGDACTVKLAGQLAITGTVTTRQVYYDGYRHHVEIQGATWANQMAAAAAITKGFEFKDKTVQQIAEALVKPLGIQFKVVGGALSSLKFPRVSIMPSEKVYDVIDKLTRYVGAHLGSNEKGDAVAYVKPTESGVTVVEGEDILEGREIIWNDALVSDVSQQAEAPGTDDKHGTKVASELYSVQKMQEFVASKLPNIVLNEHPGWSPEHLKARGNTERDWQNIDAVTLNVTVLGWLKKGGGGLWRENEIVRCRSPMLIMDGKMGLWTKSVTFSQDNRNGSRTVLELVNDKALNDMVQQQTA